MMNKGKKQRFIVFRLIQLIGSIKLILILAVLFGSLGHIIATFIPGVGAFIISKAAIGEQINYGWAIGVLLGFAVLRSLLRYSEQMANHYVAFKTLHIIRDKVYEAVARISPAKLEVKDKGEMLAVISSDIELLEVFFAHTISPVLIAIVHTLTMSIVLWQFDHRYTILLLSAHLLMGTLVPYITYVYGREAGSENRRQVAVLNSKVLETFEGIRESIQFGNGSRRLNEVQEETKKMSTVSRKLAAISGNNGAFTNSVILIAGTISVAVAAVLYQRCQVGAAGVVVPVVIIWSSFGPVAALSALANNLILTFACGRRVLGLLDEEPVVFPNEDGPEVKFENMSLENVKFAYGDGTLMEFEDFYLKKGEILGIHGKSGSGKSTLLKLIMRFYDVEYGKIAVNGVDIRHIKEKSLRENQSYMTQTAYLFKGTIRENLLVGRRDATDRDLEEACRKASIDKFIAKLEDGMDTHIDKLKSSLSTGEAQRISLARAFLHGGDLMILDEPTSNIDSLNEGIILRALSREKKHKAIIIVSHKSSTLRICDKIIERNDVYEYPTKQHNDKGFCNCY